MNRIALALIPTVALCGCSAFEDLQGAAPQTSVVVVTVEQETSAAPASSSASSSQAQPSSQEKPSSEAKPSAQPVTSQSAPAMGPCDIDTITAAATSKEFNHVAFCDGKFALVGKFQTDWTAHMMRENGAWQPIMPDGVTKTGMSRACYSAEKMARLNPPPQMKMTPCD